MQSMLLSPCLQGILLPCEGICVEKHVEDLFWLAAAVVDTGSAVSSRGFGLVLRKWKLFESVLCVDVCVTVCVFSGMSSFLKNSPKIVAVTRGVKFSFTVWPLEHFNYRESWSVPLWLVAKWGHNARLRNLRRAASQAESPHCHSPHPSGWQKALCSVPRQSNISCLKNPSRELWREESDVLLLPQHS